jgi:hypothetical protein
MAFRSNWFQPQAKLYFIRSTETGTLCWTSNIKNGAFIFFLNADFDNCPHAGNFIICNSFIFNFVLIVRKKI